MSAKEHVTASARGGTASGADVGFDAVASVVPEHPYVAWPRHDGNLSSDDVEENLSMWQEHSGVWQ